MIWIAVFICLLISFMFSGIEAGILSVNRVRLEHRYKAGDKAAIKLTRLLAHPQRLLGTVLMVTNLMNICAVLLASQELLRIFGRAGYFLSFLIFLPVFVLGTELMPKSMFRRFPYRALAFCSELLRITDILLSPILAIGSLLARLLVHRKSAENEKKKLFVAREDFKYLTFESERVGTLGKTEREMIHNVVDFRNIRARDVMVELERVAKVGSFTLIDEAAQLSAQTHADLMPVVDRRNEVVGVISVYEALLDRGKRSEVSSAKRRVIAVEPNEPAYSVFRKLRAARLGMAAVNDSNGKTLGIVRSEDLIKRLVSTATAR